jgi:hypothetical protein
VDIVFERIFCPTGHRPVDLNPHLRDADVVKKFIF